MTKHYHHRFSPFLQTLLEDLDRLIGPLFLVGGTVRSLLNGQPFANEINVLVKTSLSQCRQRLLQGGHSSVTMGGKHNSLLLSLKGQARPAILEIATFRHRPDKIPSVEEDLYHRDLTVSAMAYAWSSHELIDPFNGEADLSKKIIRFVDGTFTLREDPLRALRFVRFTLQLQGTPNSKDLITSEETDPSTIPRKKIRTELDRIFSLSSLDSKSQAFIRCLFLSTLGQGILPEMAALIDSPKNPGPTWEKALSMVLKITSPDKEEVPLLDLRWAALLHEIGGLSQLFLKKGAIRSTLLDQSNKKIRDTLEVMKFSQRRQRRILHLLNHFDLDLVPSDRLLSRLLKDEIPLDGLFRLIHIRQKIEAANDREQMSLIDDQLTRVLGRCTLLMQASQRLSPHDLALSGGDLIDLVRRPPGPWVGQIILWLLEWVGQDPTRNKPARLQEKVWEWITNQKNI